MRMKYRESNVVTAGWPIVEYRLWTVVYVVLVVNRLVNLDTDTRCQGDLDSAKFGCLSVFIFVDHDTCWCIIEHFHSVTSIYQMPSFQSFCSVSKLTKVPLNRLTGLLVIYLSLSLLLKEIQNVVIVLFCTVLFVCLVLFAL